MLAQTFKSAADLKLTDKQYTALIKTLVHLETENVKKVERADHDSELTGGMLFGLLGNKLKILKKQKKPIGFNLSYWLEPTKEHKCGTVGCIGGTAEWLVNESVFSYDDSMSFSWTDHPGLKTLFNPSNVCHSTVTVNQAARALRNFLETGHANWRKVKKQVTD